MTPEKAVETSASRLARLRELLEACTEGPWCALHNDGTVAGVTRLLYPTTQHDVAHLEGPFASADATFIAEARNALPALLAVCEAARAVVDFYEFDEASRLTDLATALENLEGEAE